MVQTFEIYPANITHTESVILEIIHSNWSVNYLRIHSVLALDSKYCSMYSHCYVTIVRCPVMSDTFLGNGLVHVFLLQWLCMQQEKWGAIYMVSRL
jgi:hypothetical protein